MNRIVVAVLLLTLASPCLAVSPEVNTQIDQTNFSVNGNCSATLIDAAAGKLLTANHCVADMYVDEERDVVDDKGEVKKKKFRRKVPGFVRQIDFKDHNATRTVQYVFDVLKTDDKADLALIQTKARLPSVVAAKVACTSPIRGDFVYAVGNPFGVLYASYSEGVVASLDRSYSQLGIDEGGDHGMIQATAPIAPGSSGGGLFNKSRELVGVTVRGLQPFSSLTLATTTEDVRKFLDMKDCQ